MPDMNAPGYTRYPGQVGIRRRNNAIENIRKNHGKWNQNQNLYNNARRILTEEFGYTDEDIGRLVTSSRSAAVDLSKWYVVFDPDDGSELQYRWHGGQTVNIYDAQSGTEIDSMTMEGVEKPTLEDAQSNIEDHHEYLLKEMAGEAEPVEVEDGVAP